MSRTSSARARTSRAGLLTVELEEAPHSDRNPTGSASREITAEWVDTATGELSRTRVAPAHREAMRRFLHRFAGQELEVALEATTGWRLVVEELERVGARGHLAEPAGRRRRSCTRLRAFGSTRSLTSPPR
jgi:hypothetical protein